MAGLCLGSQPVKAPWVKTPDPRVAIFGVNSNNLGNLTAVTNAMGHVGYYHLQSLANKLHVHRDVPVKIVALHHSPNIPEVSTAIRRKQRPLNALERQAHQIPQDERRALRLLCITHRVRLILHGHLHIAEDRRVNGFRIVGAPATTEPAKNDGRYQFYGFVVLGDGRRVNCRLHAVSV